MNPSERDHLEEQLLLRTTGELPPGELAALNRTLASDPEAAAFARFIEIELPAAARAPRDFAAAAIAAAAPARNVIAFPKLWKFAAIAAAVVAGMFVSPHFFPPDPVLPVATATTLRTTEEISARADDIEAEIATTHLTYSRGRYSRQTEI